jgi:large subunit ribosomal protein L20
MARVKGGKATKKRHKKILKQVKGYRHSRRKTIRGAKQALLKAGQHAYRDRRLKKRDFRQSWIVTINAACRQNDISYSKFINGLKGAKIGLDRKVLAQIAKQEPEEFKKIVKKIKTL